MVDERISWASPAPRPGEPVPAHHTVGYPEVDSGRGGQFVKLRRTDHNLAPDPRREQADYQGWLALPLLGDLPQHLRGPCAVEALTTSRHANDSSRSDLAAGQLRPVPARKPARIAWPGSTRCGSEPGRSVCTPRIALLQMETRPAKMATKKSHAGMPLSRSRTIAASQPIAPSVERGSLKRAHSAPIVMWNTTRTGPGRSAPFRPTTRRACFCESPVPEDMNSSREPQTLAEHRSQTETQACGVPHGAVSEKGPARDRTRDKQGRDDPGAPIERPVRGPCHGHLACAPPSSRATEDSSLRIPRPALVRPCPRIARPRVPRWFDGPGRSRTSLVSLVRERQAMPAASPYHDNVQGKDELTRRIPDQG